MANELKTACDSLLETYDRFGLINPETNGLLAEAEECIAEIRKACAPKFFGPIGSTGKTEEDIQRDLIAYALRMLRNGKLKEAEETLEDWLTA